MVNVLVKSEHVCLKAQGTASEKAWILDCPSCWGCVQQLSLQTVLAPASAKQARERGGGPQWRRLPRPGCPLVATCSPPPRLWEWRLRVCGLTQGKVFTLYRSPLPLRRVRTNVSSVFTMCQIPL